MFAICGNGPRIFNMIVKNFKNIPISNFTITHNHQSDQITNFIFLLSINFEQKKHF